MERKGRGRREKNGEGVEKKLKCGSHGVVIDIERRYREWMNAKERGIEQRILMIRTEYSV